jgi:hypothetical protein
MKQARLYADTSVFGGCFHREFEVVSRQLLDEVRSGRFSLVISETMLRELSLAPDQVKSLLTTIPSNLIETLHLNEDIEALRDAYLEARVVGNASRIDAEHIASASVADVDLIVSWNFKHIVHFDKIRGYHGVNLLMGYKPIPIHSPIEVIGFNE